MMTCLKKLPLICLICSLSGAVMAGSCAYREALMALEKGNVVRGMALMRMADRDGDRRASHYLATRDSQFQPSSTNNRDVNISVISLRQQ